MEFNRLFFVQFVILLTVAVIHVVAIVYALYFHVPWLDVLLHFLGGLWVALFILWIVSHFDISITWAHILLGVIAVGIGWEVFEIVIDPLRQQNHFLDTSVDLAMDVLGGFTGFSYNRWYEYK